MTLANRIDEAIITEVDLRELDAGTRVFAYSRRSAYEITILERGSTKVLIDGGEFSKPTKVDYSGAIGIPFHEGLAGKVVVGYHLCGSYYNPLLPMRSEDDDFDAPKNKDATTNAQFVTTPIQRIQKDPDSNVVPFRRAKRR